MIFSSVLKKTYSDRTEAITWSSNFVNLESQAGDNEDHNSNYNAKQISYLQRKAAGDKNIYFLDGTDFWDKEDYFENTVDGAHPTDLGFSLMAKKLAPVLEELLRKYGYIK